MAEPASVGKTDPAQAEIGRGTPPARTPESRPETDRQPGQAPVRDTPDVSQRPTPATRQAGGTSSLGIECAPPGAWICPQDRGNSA